MGGPPDQLGSLLLVDHAADRRKTDPPGQLGGFFLTPQPFRLPLLCRILLRGAVHGVSLVQRLGDHSYFRYSGALLVVAGRCSAPLPTLSVSGSPTDSPGSLFPIARYLCRAPPPDSRCSLVPALALRPPRHKFGAWSGVPSRRRSGPVLSNPAFRPERRSLRLARDGFTRSSTTATVSSPANGDGGVRLFTRTGFDWSDRYPRISGAVAALRTASATIDGEAVWCDDDGLAIFDRLHCRAYDREVIIYALTCSSWTARTGGRGPSMSARTGSPSSSPTPQPGSKQRAPRRGRRGDLRPRLQARGRGHRLEAPRSPLPVRTEQGLAQDQESGSAWCVALQR